MTDEPDFGALESVNCDLTDAIADLQNELDATHRALNKALAAVAAEREACAKIAEMFRINETPIRPDMAWICMSEDEKLAAHTNTTCEQVAAAIRARKED